MKKFLLVFVLAAILVTGTASADHLKSLGVGVVGGYYGSWEDGNSGSFGHFGLSLKLPLIPIFWGIHLIPHQVGDDHIFSTDVTADVYLFNSWLPSPLHWYLGIGAFFNLQLADPYSLSFGARLPIGLSLHALSQHLEFFLEIAPSIGVGVTTVDSKPEFSLPVFYPIAFGARIWI